MTTYLTARITVDPERCFGRPTIRGTRLQVSTILGHLAAEATPDEILEAFDWLERADITACLSFATQVLEGNHGWPAVDKTWISDLTLTQAQATVDEWITTTGVRYFNELTNMAILTEEVGEVARLIARQYGEQSFKKSDEGRELGDELADVLFVVICLANQTGTDLTEALARNLTKKTQRDATRHRDNPKLTGGGANPPVTPATP